MKLGPLLRPDDVLVVSSSSWGEVARALAERAVVDAPEVGAEDVVANLEGAKIPCQDGVAFPHARLPGLRRTALVVALAPAGVQVAGQRVDLVFLLTGPADAAWQHLSLLARVARLCNRPGVLRRLRAASDPATLLARLREEDAHG